MIRQAYRDLLEIYRLEDSIKNKTCSDNEIMSVCDKIISITDHYDYKLLPEKTGSGLIEDIHSLASSRATALRNKIDILNKEIEKMLFNCDERNAKNLSKKCIILHDLWISAYNKAVEPVGKLS